MGRNDRGSELPGVLPPPDEPSRCLACGVVPFQAHLERCHHVGLHVPEEMRRYAQDQMGLVEQIRRIQELPESRRKHRRVRRLLLQLRPEYYRKLDQN